MICREVEEAGGEMEIEGKGKSLVTLERTETWWLTFSQVSR